VSFSDGKIFDISAELIARVRAEYYVSKDIEKGDIKSEDKDIEIEREVKFALDDEYEVEDWAFNNMNWDDLKDAAKEAPMLPKKFNRGDEWGNCDHEIVDY
jgi:hypothetical protein